MNIQTKYINSRGFRNLVLVFFLLTCAIAAAGYLYFSQEKQAIEREKQGDLALIAQLKANQIANWRKERLADVDEMLVNYFDNPRIQRLAEIADARQRKRIFSWWMQPVNRNAEYENVYILDNRLRPLAALTENGDVPDKAGIRLVLEAQRQSKVLFGDLYRSEVDGKAYCSIAAPLNIVAGHAVQPIGAILFRIDPGRFLQPFIGAIPFPGSTCETLLIGSNGKEALYLSQPRAVGDDILLSPVRGAFLQLVTSGLRHTDMVVEGTDAAGTDVIARVERIPDSSWHVVAKENREEVFAPVRARAWLVLLLVFSFIGLAGISLGLLWYQQMALFYRKQYDAETERKAVTKHYDYLIKYANDSIFLFNDSFSIVEANENAALSYGYAAMEDMRGLALEDITAPASAAVLAHHKEELLKRGKLLVQTAHQRKDGTVFPVEISIRLIIIEWKEYYQAIVRDLGERRMLCADDGAGNTD